MALETLEILIEANASGLETQLKKATQTITSFVDKMSGQEVDWQKILAGSLDLAIIGGIASMFGEMVASSIAFQQQNQNLASSLLQTSGTMNGVSEASKTISDSTGQSAGDIKNAIDSFLPVFKNDMPSALAAATEASDLAAMGMGSVADIVKAMIPIFGAFGVTGADQINQVFSAIFAGASMMGPGMFLPAADALQGLQKNLILGGATTKNLLDIMTNLGAETAATGNLQDAATAMGKFAFAISGLADSQGL